MPAALSCRGVEVCADSATAPILSNIQASFPAQSLNALVGPSGCGKTTLLKAVLGLVEYSGDVEFGHRHEQHASSSGEITPGFVPQFSVAHANLSVAESLYYALQLKVGAVSADDADAIVARILNLVGLESMRDSWVAGLSGGQLRRLGLGLELVGEPDLLLCDEVTSGLDPLSEDAIIALLRSLVEADGKTFVCTIHNLSKLPEFDHITVLYRGHLVFQGDFAELKQWFSITDPLKLYHALATMSVEQWAKRWQQSGHNPNPDTMANEGAMDCAAYAPQLAAVENPSRASFMSQVFTLLARRFRLLGRDTGYLWLLIALTFGFPCIVVIFALKGLPQIEGLALERSGGVVEQLQGDIRYQMEAAETAALVTGLIMFQVVLLTLMGANNGAREIGSERQIYEKERLRGLRWQAYATSKFIFTGSIALFQGLWMALFVKVICQFPGPWGMQLLLMALCAIAMSWICLGLSALMRSPEKASLLSIYLVGFQLPLSGIVLALPDTVVWILRPFINAYWSWAGFFSSMKTYSIYDAYRMGAVEWLPSPSFAAIMLGLHCALAWVFVSIGCRKRQWG